MKNHISAMSAPTDSARTIPVGRGAFDSDLRFLTVDETLASLHSIPAAGMIGQPLSSVLPSLAPVISPLVKHVLATGEPILDVDVRGELPSGGLCHWLASYHPVATSTGTVIAVECAVYALDQRTPFTALATTQATTQAALHQATSQLAFQSRILANLNDAVIAIDSARRITYWGPGAERLYGLSAQEALNRPLGDVFVYEWINPGDEQALIAAIRESGLWRGEVWLARRGGAALTIAASVSTLSSHEGQITGFLAVIRDITDHRRAEAALRASEERFRAVQELSLDGIVIMRAVRDAEGAVIDFICEYLNPAAERLAGQSLATARGQRLLEHFPGAVTNGLLDRYREVLASGEPQVFEQHYDADGIAAWYRNMVVRMGDGLAISFGDITAQKQGEAALRASEERFRQFATAVDDIFWIAEPDARQLVYVNPAHERITGRSSAAIYADLTEWVGTIHPDDRERVIEAFSGCIYAGTYEEEFRILRPDGSVRWLRDRGFPIADADGNVVRAAGIAEDITLRKEHELQITFQAQMLDAVGQSVIAIDPDGTIIYWNRGAEKLYGWSSAEAQGRNALEILVGESDRQKMAAIIASVRQGSTWNGEFPVYHRDGSRLAVLSTRSPVYDSQGTLIGLISVSTDITQRKQAEQRQAQLLAFTAALAEAVTLEQVTAVIFEKVYMVIDAQAGALVIPGEDGQNVDLLRVRFSAPAQEMIRQRISLDLPFPTMEAIKTGQPIWITTQAEITARYPRLQEFLPEPAACAALPLTIQQRIVGALGMIFARPREFSSADQIYLQVVASQCALALDRARLYEAERQARMAAEDAVRLRDDLLSIVSHDLRNPLMVILGQAQLMAKQVQQLGDAGQPMLSRLTAIRDMVGQMNGQLEDLLDVARLRAGQKLILNLRPLDLADLVREVSQDIQTTSARHEIRLALPDQPLLCLGDRRRLMLVFENLLSNAVTYSPQGGPIVVSVSALSDNVGMWAVVRVQDSGLGIPAGDLPRVFERFYRGGNVARRIEGTGLGLSSARQIVEQHEGRIEAASVERQGSTFSVYLPCTEG